MWSVICHRVQNKQMMGCNYVTDIRYSKRISFFSELRSPSKKRQQDTCMFTFALKRSEEPLPHLTSSLCTLLHKRAERFCTQTNLFGASAIETDMMLSNVNINYMFKWSSPLCTLKFRLVRASAEPDMTSAIPVQCSNENVPNDVRWLLFSHTPTRRTRYRVLLTLDLEPAQHG